MLIDTHAHLNFKAFDKGRDEVIKRSLDNGVWLINASSTFSTSKLAVELAEKYPKGVYAAVGLHPIHVKDEEFDCEKYKQLAQSPKVVAIGETGLDYADFVLEQSERQQNRAPAVALSLSKGEGGLGTHTEKVKEKQKEVFLQHLELAKELDLPVIFHCRKAHQDLIEVLKSQITNPKSQINSKSQIQNSKLRGVVHCFTGTWQQAEKFLEMGFYLGFNGIIFKLPLDEIIKKTPLDRMLLETDCPFLTPPALGERRNEPIFVKYIAQRMAEIRNESLEKIAEVTTQNAKKLFDI